METKESQRGGGRRSSSDQVKNKGVGGTLVRRGLEIRVKEKEQTCKWGGGGGELTNEREGQNGLKELLLSREGKLLVERGRRCE